ncbi:MAG: antitoxin PrlF [Clostridia bacterium]|nr:antitoxin PrlF [Clostridia bacterium]
MGRQVEITKLSSRGQVVIPKEIRQQLGWEPGDHMAVEIRGDVVVLRRLLLEGYPEENSPPARVSLVK